jgi:hypothetical protein
MTIETFIEALVTIDLINETNSYGHYPFQLFAESTDGKADMNALAIGGDVTACYRRFIQYYEAGYPIIFMSLDFPAGHDIPKDFVCIIAWQNQELSIAAMPYDTNTGHIDPMIHTAAVLDMIRTDLTRLNKLS